MSITSSDSGGGHGEAGPSGTLHEVSNVLTVVMGWLEVALGLSSEAPVQDALEVALSHARFGYRVARRTIGASAEADTSVRPAREVLEDVERGLLPLARRKQVTITVDWRGLPGDLAEIESPDAAQQILVNLLLNALSFTPDGSRILVLAETNPNELIVRVTDQGPGIEASRAETILTAPSSTRSGGAGIGLVHASSLAHQHGGELRLVRFSPNATFELSWPRTGVESPLRSSPSFAPPTYLPSKLESPLFSDFPDLNVLLLEDDAAVCTLVEVAFSARGANVISARSLEDVERLGSGADVDAVLVDLSPLRGRVEEGLGLLRRCAKGAPLVLITGSASGFPEKLAAEFTSWVRKPFEPGELFEAIQRVVPRR